MPSVSSVAIDQFEKTKPISTRMLVSTFPIEIYDDKLWRGRGENKANFESNLAEAAAFWRNDLDYSEASGLRYLNSKKKPSCLLTP